MEIVVMVFTKIKREKDALKDFDQAIKLEPNNAIFYENRGYVFEKIKREKDACKDYKKATLIKPEIYEKWLNSKEMNWCRNMPN